MDREDFIKLMIGACAARIKKAGLDRDHYRSERSRNPEKFASVYLGGEITASTIKGIDEAELAYWTKSNDQ